MPIPIQIKSPNDTVPKELKKEIREQVDKLDHLYDRITRCQVSLEGPGGNRRKTTHRVVLHVAVPGSDIVVSRQKAGDLNGALHGAFNAAGRRLRKHAERQRGKVKRHDEPPAPKKAGAWHPDDVTLTHKSRTNYRHSKPDWR